jgi:hypothetical protein
MSQLDVGQPLSEARRREVFLILVDTQDGGFPVAESHEVVAGRYEVTERQLRDIEREGLENDWPPLSDS